jgi:hypothetical protein
MESNSNNKYDGEGRQVRRCARKSKFTELTNDGHSAEEEQTRRQPAESLSKREEGKDNLEVCTGIKLLLKLFY